MWSASIVGYVTHTACQAFSSGSPQPAPDIAALGKEVSALEELSQQLFLEYVDMHTLKVSPSVISQWFTHSFTSCPALCIYLMLPGWSVLQERIAYSKTLKGRYFDILGHFFSIYCIYKIFIVRPSLPHHVVRIYNCVLVAVYHQHYI